MYTNKSLSSARTINISLPAREHRLKLLPVKTKIIVHASPDQLRDLLLKYTGSGGDGGSRPECKYLPTPVCFVALLLFLRAYFSNYARVGAQQVAAYSRE